MIFRSLFKVTILLFISHFLSCNNELNDCENLRKVKIKTKDSIKVEQSYQQILKELSVKLESNDLIEFNLILLNNKKLFSSYCKTDNLGLGIHDNIPNHLLINSKGEILINEQVVTINQLTLPPLPSKQTVKIKWDNKTPIDSLEKALTKLYDNNQELYRTYSTNHFKKDICLLNEQELKEIKNKLQLQLRFYDSHTPPKLLPSPPINFKKY